MQSQLRNSDWDECSVQYNNGTVTTCTDARQVSSTLNRGSSLVLRPFWRGSGRVGWVSTLLQRSDETTTWASTMAESSGGTQPELLHSALLKRAACSCAVTTSCSLCAHRAPDFI